MSLPKRHCQNDTLPNHIHQPTQRPTLRWLFQLLEGIHRVRVQVQGQIHDVIEGLNDVKSKVLRVCGDGVGRLYQLPSGSKRRIRRLTFRPLLSCFPPA